MTRPVDDTAPATAGDPGPHGGLTGRTAAGVAWMMSQQWVLRVTGFVTVLVLTRILGPEAFGIVAVAMALIPFVQLAADMGISTYLVQADRPDKRTYDTAFWYSVVTAVVLGGVLVLCAPAIGDLLGAPAVVPVVRVLALVAPLTLMGMVPLVILRRAMRFRAIAVQSVVAGALGQVVAIVLALTGAGVWALVWQLLVYQACITVLAWVFARWLPSMRFSRARLGEMMRFGVKVVASDAVSAVRVMLENALIVAVLGTTGLGYFSIAQRLVQIAHELTTNALSPVSTVVFAQIRGVRERLRSGYLRAQFTAHALIVPAMLLIAVGGPVLYPVLFGDQWGPSIVPGQILALAGIVTMSGIDKGLYLGLGRPGAWFLYVLVVDLATILVAWLVVPYGLVAYAIGFLCVASAATAARWVMVARMLDARWWQVAAPLTRVLIPAACAAAGGFAVAWWTQELAPLLSLALSAAALLAIYLPASRIFVPNVWTELRGLSRALTSRFRPARSTT